MNFPGFFGSFMNRSPLSGRDCVEIEADPSADLFDRLIIIIDNMYTLFMIIIDDVNPIVYMTPIKLLFMIDWW